MIVEMVIPTMLLLLFSQTLARSTHEQSGFYLRITGGDPAFEWHYIEVTKAGRLALLHPSLYENIVSVFRGTLRDGRLFSITPRGIVKENPIRHDGGLGVVEHDLANIGFCFLDDRQDYSLRNDILAVTSSPNSLSYNLEPSQFYLCTIPYTSPDLVMPDGEIWSDLNNPTETLGSYYLYTKRQHDDCFPIMLVREDFPQELEDSASRQGSLHYK